jgi:hypothetical protein
VSPQDLDAALARPGSKLSREPALADTGLAPDEHEVATSRRRGVECLDELRELRLTPDELRAAMLSGGHHRTDPSLR